MKFGENKLRELIWSNGLKFKIYHTVEDGKRKRRMTVCRIIDEKGNVLGEGVAFCSEKDQFVKKIGRVKAMGRAVSEWMKQTSTRYLKR